MMFKSIITRTHNYHFLLIAFVLFFSPPCIFPQQIKIGNGSNFISVKENSYNNLSLSFSLQNFLSLDVNTPQGVFSKIMVDNYGNSFNFGSPNLPVLRKLIEIPINSKIKINITAADAKEYSLSELGIKFPLLPAQHPVSKDSAAPYVNFDYNHFVYLSDAFFNSYSSPVSVELLGIMKGLNLGRINISPFAYNPLSSRLKIFSRLEIEITFENPDIQKTKFLKQLNSSHSLPLKSVINYKPLNYKEYIVQYPVKYVIVSHPMFRDSLRQFVRWKTQKGFNVIEAYTDNPEVGDSKESIKNYLTNLYANASQNNLPPAYILIVGDIDKIPSFRGTGSQNYYFTDLPYAEYTGDYLPEAYYGRFSANTIADLMPQIHKTIQYEKFLFPDPSFLSKAMLIAGYDNTYSWMYANGQMNYAYANYFNSSLGFNTYFTKHPLSAKQASVIKQNFSNGAAIINYSAHGSWDGWVNPGFKNSDIAPLMNKDMFPVVISNACYTSQFDKPSCFAESLLRAKDKGAVGHIGASSESYWDEDFWWSIGLTNIDTLPKYGPHKSLGAYDRLFHSHKEPFSDWYVTLAQIIFAGNIAVMESGTPESNFYWETYNLMGDPSLMPYLALPSQLKLDYQKNLPLSIPSVSFSSHPFAYIAVSHNDSLLGAAIADSNGIANIYINNPLRFIKASVVATAQNKMPVFDSISFFNPDKAFLVLNYKNIKKIIGADDGKANFGETVSLDINVKNIGIAPSAKVNAKLISYDKFISITDSSSDIEIINPLDSITLSNAFIFKVDSLVPDQHKALFILQLSDNAGNDWAYNFSLTLNSPAFSFFKPSVNDMAKGNNNARLDPGESADLIIPTANSGNTVAMAAIGRLSSLNKYIKINNKSFSLGNLPPKSSDNAIFNISVDENIPPGTPVQFTYMAISGSYLFLKYYTIVIGSAQEDFETANFKKFKWQNETYNPWVISDTLPFDGKYAAHSKYIYGSGNSTLTISFNSNENDSISFFSKIKADTNGNYLLFYIDDDLIGQWNGYHDWKRFAFPVRPGYHTFKWIFSKYAGYGSLYDCAWLDNIKFPSSTDLIINDISYIANNSNDVFNCYPNPFSNKVNVSFFLDYASDCSLQIFDFTGKLLPEQGNTAHLQAGRHSVELNTRLLPPGIYFLRLNTDRHSFTKKIIRIK